MGAEGVAKLHTPLSCGRVSTQVTWTETSGEQEGKHSNNSKLFVPQNGSIKSQNLAWVVLLVLNWLESEHWD